MTLSQVLYSLWLGANLQAKITRSARRWKAPLPTPNRLLRRLRYNRRFYFISY